MTDLVMHMTWERAQQLAHFVPRGEPLGLTRSELADITPISNIHLQPPRTIGDRRIVLIDDWWAW